MAVASTPAEMAEELMSSAFPDQPVDQQRHRRRRQYPPLRSRHRSFTSRTRGGRIQRRPTGCWRIERADGTLTWYGFDRQGRRISDIPDADAQTGLSLSPDGARVAVGRRDRYVARSVVWTYDLSRAAGMPLTFFASVQTVS